MILSQDCKRGVQNMLQNGTWPLDKQGIFVIFVHDPGQRTKMGSNKMMRRLA